MIFDLGMIKNVYQKLDNRIDTIRKNIKRPLTLTEKNLFSHLYSDQQLNDFSRGKDYVNFSPDRVTMQDATAQMAMLQFMQAGKNKTDVPASIHADHLIQAEKGARDDLNSANITNKEVYDFLGSVAKKYGVDFWKPGAGIIHQVFLEKYAFPGGMAIGSDSHTVNAGGLSMIAIGVGGADIVDVMVGMPWELLFPRIVGVKLTGKMSGWTSAKDVILKVAGIMTVKGGTGKIVEYFGEGAEAISCTGKGTICNMGAEIGATTSIFGYDHKMYDYLCDTGRKEIADLAEGVKDHLNGDPEVYADPKKYFDEVIEIDLSTLEPHVNGPFTPDRAIPVSKFKEEVEKNNWPERLEVGLIGSCTNSSYEDITRAASIAKQAKKKNIKVQAELTITPGSEQVRATIERDGLINTFEEIGGVVLANACGPCIGQWKRHTDDPTRKNSIITSFNRNFSKRNDGNPNTHAFVASPEIVTAYVLSGNLRFNPITDTITTMNGQTVKLDPPQGLEAPEQGYAISIEGYAAPAEDGSSLEVSVSPTSDRLQILNPFPVFDIKNYQDMYLLIKAQGKCTTDHISMAGPWLKYRGHLDNISNNMLIGAINAFNGKANLVKNPHSGEYQEVPQVQRENKLQGITAVVVGDENYGEGSSREHAAMEPRHLGVFMVLVKSFARIHETNLKKQGMLAATFVDPNDYEKIQEGDRFKVLDVENLMPGKNLMIEITHGNGNKDQIEVKHTYNENQIAWFKAGSALNLIKKKTNNN